MPTCRCEAHQRRRACLGHAGWPQRHPSQAACCVLQPRPGTRLPAGYRAWPHWGGWAVSRLGKVPRAGARQPALSKEPVSAAAGFQGSGFSIQVLQQQQQQHSRLQGWGIMQSSVPQRPQLFQASRNCRLWMRRDAYAAGLCQCSGALRAVLLCWFSVWTMWTLSASACHLMTSHGARQSHPHRAGQTHASRHQSMCSRCDRGLLTTGLRIRFCSWICSPCILGQNLKGGDRTLAARVPAES